jgi:hypothetical protein
MSVRHISLKIILPSAQTFPKEPPVRYQTVPQDSTIKRTVTTTAIIRRKLTQIPKLPTYRMAQKSINLKYYIVLTGMFCFKPPSQFMEEYHSGVTCAPNTEDVIKNNFYKFSK